MHRLRRGGLVLLAVLGMLLGVADPAGATTYYSSSFRLNPAAYACDIQAVTNDNDNSGPRVTEGIALHYSGCEAIGVTTVGNVWGSWVVSHAQGSPGAPGAVQTASYGSIVAVFYQLQFWGHQCMEYRVQSLHERRQPRVVGVHLSGRVPGRERGVGSLVTMENKQTTDEVALQNQAGREKGKAAHTAQAERDQIEANKAGNQGYSERVPDPVLDPDARMEDRQVQDDLLAGRASAEEVKAQGDQA